MILTSDFTLQRKLKRWARYLILSALTIAALQLFEILFGIDFLNSLLPDLRPMNIASVIGIIMAVTAFLLRIPRYDSKSKQLASKVILVLLLFGSVWRFFSFVLKDIVYLPVGFGSESISTSTAFCGFLTAIVLFLINSKRSQIVKVTQYIAVLIFLYANFSICVNSYHAQSFKGAFTVPMSIYSAICFLFIATAALLANSDKGLMKELATHHAGGLMARRLIPGVIIIPFLYGFARIYFQLAGYYDTKFGTALAVMAIGITGLIVIFYNATQLNKRDLLKRQAEQDIKQINIELEKKVIQRTEDLNHSEQRFRKILESNYEMISLSDEKFIPFYRSPASIRLTGWSLEESAGDDKGGNQVHPDDAISLKNILKEVLVNFGKPYPVSFRTMRKDGHYIWLEGFMTNMLHDESLKGILGNFRDVTERKKKEEEINKLTIELRQLLEHLQTSREDERKYIAREIHDELGSSLTALKIDVSLLHKKSVSKSNEDNKYMIEELTSVINQIDKAIDSVKKISLELRPEILDHLGIIDAVKWRVQQFENMTGIPCKVSCLPDLITLRKELSAPVYRIVQEALTNVARHSQASLVKILIKADSENILVEINDNGKGIRDEDLENPKAFGLIGMRERVRILNGRMSIVRNEGMGTTVSVKIPL
jgi:PAS domain S-box-containing protein